MVTALDLDGARGSWTVADPRPSCGAHVVRRVLGGRVLGERPEALAAGLSGFPGARGRMQLVGERQGMRVVESFAHHPTAIAWTSPRHGGRLTAG
ncbi:hypothetical protein [Streptomyces malaysiensis]|uniref:hypothetical protein n=1 Tax=Streptomyces malaysiensis TaxID=92644 RepID=UPI00142EBD6F|nr:hypothetical protein [Streptomyces malaysiensis]